MSNQKIINGDSLQVLKTFGDNHFDSIVSDPPYGLSFMGKKWDYDIPSVELWKEAFRVLKAGGYILAACGTRTQHRMVVNIEDAGFEIRDVITWHYGSGFPKSLDISKAIDKFAGAEREIIGKGQSGAMQNANGQNSRPWHENNKNEEGKIEYNITAPSTEDAKKWNGWGTALKPATEFWTLARKPLSEKTVAENVLKYGTGGINIDGCRISTDEQITNHSRSEKSSVSKGKYGDSSQQETHQTSGQALGRFPANVIFDEEAGKILDEQSGILKSGQAEIGTGREGNYTKGIYGAKESKIASCYADEGGASRFFYCAKASKGERNKGLEINNHPTVKPIKLMQYLVRMITPPNGLCLDPYNGSGTTGIACKLEGVNYIGIEREKKYCDISEARIGAWGGQQPKEVKTDTNKTDSGQAKLF